MKNLASLPFQCEVNYSLDFYKFNFYLFPCHCRQIYFYVVLPPFFLRPSHDFLFNSIMSFIFSHICHPIKIVNTIRYDHVLHESQYFIYLISSNHLFSQHEKMSSSPPLPIMLVDQYEIFEGRGSFCPIFNFLEVNFVLQYFGSSRSDYYKRYVTHYLSQCVCMKVGRK